MAIVVPAILESTIEGFLEKKSIIKMLPGLERVQVDFADGKFVANKTISIQEIDTLNPAYIWEAHLMVEEPMDFLDYQICGFKCVLVHYEAYTNKEILKKALGLIREHNMQPGLVINPSTPAEVCLEFKEFVDQFLVMGVEPGFQGAEFIETTYDKLSSLRKLIPHVTIEIDGGVNFERIVKLKEAGADLLAVGSALFKSPQPSETFQKLSDGVK